MTPDPRLRPLLPAVLACLLASCGKGGAPGPASPPPKDSPAARIPWNPDFLLAAPGEFIAEPGSGDSFLEGTVVDEAGAPVPGAEVAVHALPRMGTNFLPPRLHARTTAGPDGAFRVGPGPSPWWNSGILSAAAPGFARTSLVSRFLTTPGKPCAEVGEPARLVLRRGFPVRGEVRAKDGGPPDGVLDVWAVGADGGFDLVTTDASGAFSFLAAPGEMNVRVLDGPHPAAQATVVVEPGEGNRVSLAVVRGRDVRGRVVEASTGRPVPGAVIRANYGVTRIFRAGEDGEFLLPRYWYGGFQVRAPGYAMKTHRLADDAGSEGVPPETVRLSPGFVARGRVLDLDGRPLAGARLRILTRDPVGDWSGSAGPYSGPDGTFTFVGLPLPGPGLDVPLFATAPECGWGVSAALPGAPGAVLDGVELRVPRMVDVEGRVEDGDGVPLGAGIDLEWDIPKELAVYEAMFPSRLRGEVGPDGTWRFRLPERTPFRLVARGDLFADGRLEASTPARGARDVPPFVVKVDRGLSLRGRVVDAAGRPVDRGEVRVEPHPPTDPRPSRDARIRPDGTFEAGGLAPGAYDFSVLVHPEFLQEVVRDVAAGSPPSTVVLRRPGGLRFRVVLPPGLPEGTAPKVSLRALEDTRPLAPDHDLTLEPSDPRAVIGPLAPAAYSLVITAGDFRADLPRIVVVQRDPTDLGDVELKPGGAVAGRVTLAGVPLPGVSVEALRVLPSGGAESARRETTGPDGAFRLGGLRPGLHHLAVRCPDRPFVDLSFESEPGKEAALEVPLAAGGRLRIAVKDAAGSPVAGARVALSRGGISLPCWREGSPAPGPHETGPAGTLRCTGIPAGEVLVRAERPGGGSGEAPATVADGGEGEVEVRLGR